MRPGLLSVCLLLNDVCAFVYKNVTARLAKSAAVNARLPVLGAALVPL
jgi:hypothetical protein